MACKAYTVCPQHLSDHMSFLFLTHSAPAPLASGPSVTYSPMGSHLATYWKLKTPT